MKKAIVLSLSLAACGSGGGNPNGLQPATLTADATVAQKWAGYSAPIMVLYAYSPFSSADSEAAKGNCPMKTVSGDTATYTGGCTDADGHEWVGSATVEGVTSTTHQKIDYNLFGDGTPQQCGGNALPNAPTFVGTFEATKSSGVTSFTINLTSDAPKIDFSCHVTHETGTVDYTGTTKDGTRDDNNDGQPDDQQWDGAGQVGNTTDGVASVTTTAEVLDNVACSHEALSGTTAISSGGHTIEIDYDGAQSCDTNGTVGWKFDGQTQGELTGVGCSVGHRGSPASLLAALAFIASVLAARRRRR